MDEPIKPAVKQSHSVPRNGSAATAPAAETAVADPPDIELSMNEEEIDETGSLPFWMATMSKETCVCKFFRT